MNLVNTPPILLTLLSDAEAAGWEQLDTLLLDAVGSMRVPPAAGYASIPKGLLRAWCHHRGVYQLPTRELVDHLRDQVKGYSAIEIGAGRGWLGRALGIPMTDAKTMDIPAIRAQYAAMGQPLTPYGEDVEHLDALEAVRKYQPDIVIGCWITQRRQDGDLTGHPLGVDEMELLRRVKSYVLVGNEAVHGEKRIRALPHRTQSASWILSRAQRPDLNRIYTWGET